MGRDIPWLEETHITGVKANHFNTSAKWHILFACLVQIRSAKDRDQLKWGWNWGALLQEAASRQELFIESQHFLKEPGCENYLEEKTFSFRYINKPENQELQIALIGKICGNDHDTTILKAKQFWHEIRSSFPYDYQLIPARTRNEFVQLTGWDLITNCNELTISEIIRYENIVNTGKEQFYYLGSWKISEKANEQIWRILGGANQHIVFDILLRPTVLSEVELISLSAIQEYVQSLNKKDHFITVQPYIDFASRNYSDMLQQFRHPYIVQIRIASPDKLPEYILRDICFAYMYEDNQDTSSPGVQYISPRNFQNLECWKSQILYLEPDIRQDQVIDVRFVRLRKMCGVKEATAIFRLPYPPTGGFPNVRFTESLTSD